MILLSVNAFAKADNRQEYKCHVELLGGQETIYFITLPAGKDLNHVARIIINNKARSKQQRIIHQVKECVVASEAFSGSLANELEKKLIR